MTEENPTVNVQKAEAEVNHRNINAAGDGHPFGDDAKEFTAELSSLIRRVADDLYESWEATVREYLANAETACLRTKEYVETGSTGIIDDDATLSVSDSYQPKIEVEWNRQEDKLTIHDNGIGMSADTVDKVFRQVGRTTSRDDGQYSGNFGQGVLSFVKLVGLDNAMIMTSHSRLNDDNAAYYVTLAGVEPIRGQLQEDEYGTTFQMTPDGSYNIREAIERYSEWMRVPVRYEEIGLDGEVSFQEDYGDKELFDAYDDNRACLGIRKEGAFEAYASPDSFGETLLLSMSIDRNDGKHQSGQHGSPFQFDVRLLDESGKVIESSNGNEGLMPVVQSDYEQMLIDAREPYITRELLNNKDIIGQELTNSDVNGREGSIVVSDDDYESIMSGEVHVPPNDYLRKSDLLSADEPGEARVIFGPNKGRVVVGESEWEDMSAGRAEMYVPECELEEYDVESGEGDLRLPQPTSDRDRLKEHPTFWEYIGSQFAEQFNEKVDEVYQRIEESEDALETIMNMDAEELVVSPEGFGE
jgi:hypothetical protein